MSRKPIQIQIQASMGLTKRQEALLEVMSLLIFGALGVKMLTFLAMVSKIHS